VSAITGATYEIASVSKPSSSATTAHMATTEITGQPGDAGCVVVRVRYSSFKFVIAVPNAKIFKYPLRN
jgi:hypothetical protein